MKKDEIDKYYEVMVINEKRKMYIQNYFVGNPEDDKRILKEAADIILGNK